MREKVPKFIDEFLGDDKTVKHAKYCKTLRFVYKGGNCPGEKQNIILLKKLGLLSFVWVKFHKSGKKEVNILSLRYTRSLIP